MQTEFRWEKDQLLDDVQLPANAKAILRRVGRFVECYEAQETMRKHCGFKTRRTVHRWLQWLSQRDLVTTERRWNPRLRVVVNHHRVNWEAVRRLVDNHKTDTEATTVVTVREPPLRAPAQPDQCDSSPPTNVTFSRDQCDSESRPMGLSVTTNVTLSHPTRKKLIQKKLTTTIDRVGTASDRGVRTIQPVVSVVSLEDQVLECGVDQANYAVHSARQILGLSDAEITERITAFRALSDDRQEPGVLYNWLCRPRSYASFVAKQQATRVLKLCGGLTAHAERKRADLIQYGRRQGWDFDTIQRAVTRFEQEQHAQP